MPALRLKFLIHRLKPRCLRSFFRKRLQDLAKKQPPVLAASVVVARSQSESDYALMSEKNSFS